MPDDRTAAVYAALLQGREREREAAIAEIDAASATREPDLDLPRLRVLILDALRRDAAGGLAGADRARGWFVAALARVAGDDAAAREAVLRVLDDDADEWTRYWALEGIVEGRWHDAVDVARRVRGSAPARVAALATALLAAREDKEAEAALLTALGSQDHETKHHAVRALRVVPVAAAVGALAGFVAQPRRSDLVYDALFALGRYPRRTRAAVDAARALATFVATQTSAARDAMRARALVGLGALGLPEHAGTVLDQMTDENPAIARAAAEALQSILTTATATARVLESAAADRTRRQAFGRALRWMDRAVAVEVLEDGLVAPSPATQEAARALLEEIGGAAAAHKLARRHASAKEYLAAQKDTEQHLRDLFAEVMRDGKRGFEVTLVMDQAVFWVSLALFVAGAVVALASGGSSLGAWAGGATAAVGGGGMAYVKMWEKPRKQVEESTERIMEMHTVFLGYLRQLHQVDQAFTRRILDDRDLTPEEVAAFHRMVERTMQEATRALRRGTPPVAPDTPVAPPAVPPVPPVAPPVTPPVPLPPVSPPAVPSLPVDVRPPPGTLAARVLERRP